MKEQIKSGLDVHIVYLKGEPELKPEFIEAGAKVHQELALKHPLLQPYLFRKIIAKTKPIVHAHLPRAELIALVTLSNFKFFVSRHNAEPFFPGAPKFISNLLSKLVEARSIKVIAISNAVKDYLVSRGEIYNQNNIAVVLYGYRRHKLGNVSPNVKDAKNIKIGTISRLTEQKDIPTMLSAFRIFHTNHPGSILSILGAGPLATDLKKQVSAMGLRETVIFGGRSSKIYDFLSELDIFILTSKYEGFGMVLLEAMDAGIPILASNNSAIPEVLGENFLGLCKTGNPDDFASKLELLNDPEFRELLLSQQKARLKCFEADRMCKKIEELYSL